MATSPTDERFDGLAARFLRSYLELFPVEATLLGEHRFDDQWPDVSRSGDARALAFADETHRDLDQLDPADLSPQRRIDHEILRERLEGIGFSIQTLRPRDNDPLHYLSLLGDGLDPLLVRPMPSVDERMNALAGRLRSMSAVVDTARERLANPPAPHTETALRQCQGLIELCDNRLLAHAAACSSDVRDRVAGARTAALESLRGLHAFLEALIPNSQGEPRLGRDTFQRKLELDLETSVSCDDVARRARQLLDATRSEMIETAETVWREVSSESLPPRSTPEERASFLRQVLARIGEDRPSNATIVAEAEAILRQATDFVRERDLVEIPDEECEVIEMPEYRRGVSIAYCDAPGPLEKSARTYYAIAPTPSDWSPERVSSFYREYNRAMLIDLTVHEAMPGHFLQLCHSRRFPSAVRAVFGSGPFIEGWAVYTEWLMAHHGFGGAKSKLMRQKMVLRLAANALLDHGVHAAGMTEAEAMHLLMDEAFQEEGEAAGKWRRALLTSAQLSTYFHGFSAVMAARHIAEESSGFSERHFHDRLLSFGSPPVRYLPDLVSGG